MAIPEKSILKLVARGNRAFREYMPMRETQAEAEGAYIARSPTVPCSTSSCWTCDPIGPRTPTGTRALIFGPTQLAWLKRELMNSQATWKVIAARPADRASISSDAIALGNGAPHGREHEVADLLAFIKHAGVRNTGLDDRRHALHGGALL